MLWNRLGSSLSNGSKPEEALGAYREALQLRPTYTRAIYNVGVACTLKKHLTVSERFPSDSFIGLNIGADKEAAEHFLSALSLQESTNGDTSDQLWFTLRRSLLSMVVFSLPFFSQIRINIHSQNRPDLVDLAKPEAKSNLDAFRREGFDF